MVANRPHARYTIEEYLRLEAYSNIKHEYSGGGIYAMGGGTPEHAAMAARISFAFSRQLVTRRCKVYTSDARVRVVATGLDAYPDVTVACGSEERDREDPNALTNPVLLVEIQHDALDLLARLPEEEIGRDRSAEEGDQDADVGWIEPKGRDQRAA